MNSTKTVIMAMIVAFAMIGMTGFAAAMNTNVVYSGDGQYNCNYNADGTGYIGIHTYTNDGADHLMSGWTNSQADGWQEMDTYGGTGYSATVISREATVGDVGDGEDESGYIYTHTTDGNGNYIASNAVYHDNKGYGSHVTTEQSVIVGSVNNAFGTEYDVTGVVAATNIRGYSYGSDTVVSGSTTTRSGDAYTYTSLYMYNGRMDIQTYGIAGSVPDEDHGACGQIVIVDYYTKGIGRFASGAGVDMHGMYVDMYDDLGHTEWDETGSDTHVGMTTTFDGNFEAVGYVYAVDLP